MEPEARNCAVGWHWNTHKHTFLSDEMHGMCESGLLSVIVDDFVNQYIFQYYHNLRKEQRTFGA